MKSIHLILAALVCIPPAFADTWLPPEPKAYASASGRFVVRILPGDYTTKQNASAVIFELETDGGSYRKLRVFPLVNEWAPVAACISDAGDLYTFDDWGMMGSTHVAVWYSADGEIKAEFTLEQLFPKEPLGEIREKHRSKSSIRWRKGVPWINGPHVIIDDALGGHVSITNGVIDYSPPEQK